MPTFAEQRAFEKECLVAHNEYRSQHGCPALKISKSLSKKAVAWAQHLIDNNKMQHSEGTDYGENIYKGSSATAKVVTKAWYDEVKSYNFSAAKFSKATGHFTQLIWKDTRDLGVGYATNGKITIVVAQYKPAGNVAGKFQENVPPKQEESASSKKAEKSKKAASAAKGKKGADSTASSSSSASSDRPKRIARERASYRTIYRFFANIFSPIFSR